MLAGHQVLSENTQVFHEELSKQPDILVTSPARAPLVVECEYDPARNVEQEAASRLGLTVVGQGHPVETTIALRYPNSVPFADDLGTAISEARLSYAVLYGDGRRFPISGWLRGQVSDLADIIRLVSVPEKAVNDATDALQDGIERASWSLDTLEALGSGRTRKVAGMLGLTDSPQTRRMATAILANAMIFHQRLSRVHEEIDPIRVAFGADVVNPLVALLRAWDAILGINYWAIFAIARDILNEIPDRYGVRLLRILWETVESFEVAGVDHANHLTGQIFQRLISDRKYLATFYTRPESAALLARLAVSKLDGMDWGDAEAIGNLRVGDFACGTGALLSAVYEQIADRHANAGGDPTDLHAAMIEEVLYGCDVMPSAIHLTGSTLSGVCPHVGFRQSRLYTMPYGQQEDESVKIGSLELLQSSEVVTLFTTSDPALRTGSSGEEAAAHVNVEVSDEMFDLVIMNPPFTRAGSDWEGSERHEDYVKQFRGLSTDLATQKAMSARLKEQSKGTCYHGFAGIASAFVALADKKLKPGGILALVLPLTVAAGASWERVRSLLASDYDDISVLSISSARDDVSFSSDTSIAECLVIARKRGLGKPEKKPVLFGSLNDRPSGFESSAAIARGMVSAHEVRGISDGPYGGSPITVGDSSVGEMLTVNVDRGLAWGAVRLMDVSVAQTAHAVAASLIWLPGTHTTHHLPVALLSEIGNRGWHDMNLAGPNAPFYRSNPSRTSTYPSLWSHNAKSETRLVCEPDSQIVVRQGSEGRAAQAWATASRAHLNRDFGFGSQPLAAAFTERKSIGGRAWPNVGFPDDRFDFPFVLWCNSTLGLLSFWWHSNKQQPGRGIITIRSAESLPVLDLRKLSDDQLSIAESIFDEFRDKDLKPAYLADADPNRALLDRRVVCDLLGFDEDVYEGVRRLAAKWCAEPSVHGGKKRPTDAELVV